jgi:hypothetical protein
MYMAWFLSHAAYARSGQLKGRGCFVNQGRLMSQVMEGVIAPDA